MDDTAIIGYVLRGDTRAYEALVRGHQVSVLRLARNILRDHHEAEDAAQEAFVEAYRNLHRYDPSRSAFSTWLLTIARNKCLKALRNRRPIPPGACGCASACPAADRAAEGRELFDRLDAVLADLPVEQRFAFVLVELLGLSPKEAAEVEDIQPGTLRSRLSRAKAALRAALKEHAGDRI